MALPTLNSSTYTTVIPSTGKKVKFRPYLVKEEKILLVALESEDNNQIIQAMRDVIEACVEDVNTSEFTSLDLEYIFLMLRSKSVGEGIDLKMSCQNSDCDATLDINIDIEDIEVPNFDESSKTIELTKEIGVVLKFPSLLEIQGLDESLSEIDRLMSLLVSCVVSIYDENNVYDARDESVQSITNFIESLNSSQFKKITSFFDKIPKLEHSVQAECKNGHSNNINLEGIQSFFT
jgi:hypothetical protein